MDFLILFVHGYSVTSFDTYGGLPERMRNEALARGFQIEVDNLFLGRYISFDDEIRLNDVSRAFEVAIRQRMLNHPGKRFICITHSTGGPVLRNWYKQFYQGRTGTCPVSHLIMLAPANHGSALAILGKSKLSRIRSWFDGIEPGQKILNWLELGSNEAWELNRDWIINGAVDPAAGGVWMFVITGQDIDRKLYDHINSYTGEIGSDGVVRVASANLNASYIRLTQELKPGSGTSHLVVAEQHTSREVPLRVVGQKSHSNEEMGIMRSIRADLSDTASLETLDAIFNCMAVTGQEQYDSLGNRFSRETADVQRNSRLETENKLLRQKHYIHDRHAMIIFRVVDGEGHLLSNYDLLLTGDNNDPDLLPEGFFVDRQCNSNRSSLTYYFNYDVMRGTPAVIGPQNKPIRDEMPGMREFGIIVRPRPDQGMIRYQPAEFRASAEFFHMALRPNSTTHIEIELKRQVNEEVFRLETIKAGKDQPDFRRVRPGENYII
jgi:hypothetical protein